MNNVMEDDNIIRFALNKDVKEDIHLVKAAIKGEEKEFISLIEGYKSYLYKMAFLYVKNEQDALDIYQETIYKAYANLPNLKKPSFFKTWITRILINSANDKLNLKSKQEVVNIDVLNNTCISTDSVSIEEKIDLYDAIDSLDEKYKTPIILMYFHGMSIKEISKIMDCRENTVKSYIHRAKGILLKSLKEEL